MTIPTVPRPRRIDREEVRRLRAGGYSIRAIVERLKLGGVEVTPAAVHKVTRTQEPPTAKVEARPKDVRIIVEGASTEDVARAIGRALKRQGYTVTATSSVPPPPTPQGSEPEIEREPFD